MIIQNPKNQPEIYPKWINDSHHFLKIGSMDDGFQHKLEICEEVCIFILPFVH